MRTVNSTTGGKTNHLALSLIQARPLGGQTCGRTGKKGSDKGIDGIKVFVDDNSGKAKRVIVQVKSGHVKSGDIRDLVGTQNTHHRDTESTEKGSSKNLSDLSASVVNSSYRVIGEPPPQLVSSPPNTLASFREYKFSRLKIYLAVKLSKCRRRSNAHSNSRRE